MTRPVLIVTPGGTRRLDAADLPVRIGTGQRDDIRLPGPVADRAVALDESHRLERGSRAG